MAEQIAANLNLGQDTNALALKLVDHIQRFWDPRMRAELLRYAETPGAELSPVLQAAANTLRDA